MFLRFPALQAMVKVGVEKLLLGSCSRVWIKVVVNITPRSDALWDRNSRHRNMHTQSRP